jgi:hydroxymethylbilane synthase
VKIGTRRSALALRQARIVQSALGEKGIDTDLVTFTTTGDKHFGEPLSTIGAKGLFTRELETALAKGKIDCAVHSLKDLPTESADAVVVAAVLRREDPRDVVVLSRSASAVGLGDLAARSRVGTSSLRRRAQLLALRPDLDVVELRGNVPTRLRKVEQGQVHAAILAAAGLHRLNATQRIATYLDPPDWLPAPGQGAIAVQVRSDDDDTRAAVRVLSDEETLQAVTAERAFLAALEGGCQVPIGALVAGSVLHGLIADPEGGRIIRGSHPVTPDDPAYAGRALARALLEQGAGDILAGMRPADRVLAPQPE